MNIERLTELAEYLDKQDPDSYDQDDCKRCALESFRQCFGPSLGDTVICDTTDDQYFFIFGSIGDITEGCPKEGYTHKGFGPKDAAARIRYVIQNG